MGKDLPISGNTENGNNYLKNTSQEPLNINIFVFSDHDSGSERHALYLGSIGAGDFPADQSVASTEEQLENDQQPASTDLILESDAEYLTIPIVKGAMGFGFTIADSSHGQKVRNHKYLYCPLLDLL